MSRISSMTLYSPNDIMQSVDFVSLKCFNDENLLFIYIFTGIYGAFGSAQVVSLVIYSAIMYIGSVKAAKIIHRSMLKVILRCPMSIFDTTPLGKI